MPLPEPPIESDGGGGSGQSGGATTTQEVVKLAIERTTFKLSGAGTLNLGLRFFNANGEQLPVKHSDGADSLNVSVTTTETSLEDLLKTAGAHNALASIGNGVYSVGPIVVPYYNGNIEIKRYDPDLVNKSITAFYRVLGYGDLVWLGYPMRGKHPVVHRPLWMYGLRCASASTLTWQLLDKDARTVAEGTSAMGAGTSYTVKSLLAGSYNDSAIQLLARCDQTLQYNYGGNPNNTLAVNPAGSRQIESGHDIVLGEVTWPEDIEYTFNIDNLME